MIRVESISGKRSGETEFGASRGTLIAAGIAVAATYFYFLIYAEFALLELARPVVAAESWRLRGIMVALGIGGVVGSVWAGWRFEVLSLQARLSWSFRACAVGAALALGGSHWTILVLASLVSGMSLGALTVNLAASLRPVVGTAKLGWVIGIGTGVAYALCNVPVIFEASARVQTILAAVVAASASVASPFLVPSEPSVSPEPEYQWGGLLRWVGVLTLLVWLDSAAFFVFQHAEALKERTWSGNLHLWTNALVHLVAALAVGKWLDRGARAAPVVLALVALGGACLLLERSSGTVVALLYTAGVSLYSVVLVYYPARGGRAVAAALVYSLAGWGGSALGIGMAQDLRTVPAWFVGVAGGVVAVLLSWRWFTLRRTAANLMVLGALAAALMVSDAEAETGKTTAAEAQVLRGREVYIAEGCIHCHSQYLRPTVAAEREVLQALGPRPDAGSPPLFGNRRQGPDLTTVGRRLPAADWHRLHLINPRAVRPSSRMPAYSYLFDSDDERGPALVAYLMSLGKPAQP